MEEMNIGQALAWANTMAIVKKALDIAITKKRNGTL